MPSVKNSTNIVFEQYYREEDRHFRESLSEEEKKNTQLFIRKLKEHVLYHLVVINYKKRSLINKWLLEYVEENCDKEEQCEECGVKGNDSRFDGMFNSGAITEYNGRLMCPDCIPPEEEEEEEV